MGGAWTVDEHDYLVDKGEQRADMMRNTIGMR